MEESKKIVDNEPSHETYSNRGEFHVAIENQILKT